MKTFFVTTLRLIEQCYYKELKKYKLSGLFGSYSCSISGREVCAFCQHTLVGCGVYEKYSILSVDVLKERWKLTAQTAACGKRYVE